MSNDIEDEVILLMQGWANRPRDLLAGGRQIREHVVPRKRCFASDGSELLADRTTEMFYADGRRETGQDRIYGDPCESRRLTAEEWIGQTWSNHLLQEDGR